MGKVWILVGLILLFSSVFSETIQIPIQANPENRYIAPDNPALDSNNFSDSKNLQPDFNKFYSKDDMIPASTLYWFQIINFPKACPEGYAISKLAVIPICTLIKSSSFDLNGLVCDGGNYLQSDGNTFVCGTPSGGGGNPFDQNLNTFDSPTFVDIYDSYGNLYCSGGGNCNDSLVPYIGATANVDLGVYGLTASNSYFTATPTIVDNVISGSLHSTVPAFSNLVRNGSLYEFEVYAEIDDVGGNKIFSDVPFVFNYDDSSEVSPDPFNIYFDWMPVTGVATYRIVVKRDDYSGYYGDHYIDIGATSFTYDGVTGVADYGSQVPTHPNSTDSYNAITSFGNENIDGNILAKCLRLQDGNIFCGKSDFGSGGTSLWKDNGDGTISNDPTTNRVLVGGAVDDTTSALQVSGVVSSDAVGGNLLLKDTSSGYATWTVASATLDVPSGNGITFTNDAGDGGFRVGTAGETYFFGYQTAFSYADRSNSDPSASGGFLMINGVQSIWSSVAYYYDGTGGVINVANNGDVAIGKVPYGRYTSDATTSNIPAPFFVSGSTMIDPIGRAIWDTTSALQVSGVVSSDAVGGNLLLKDTSSGYATWTVASATLDVPSGNGITFTNDAGDGGFRVGTAGETYFFGYQTAFSYADRSNSDPSASGGFLMINGVQSIWSSVAYYYDGTGGVINVANNGDVAIGKVPYGSYASDATTSNIPAPFFVSGSTMIDPIGGAIWDTTSALQVNGTENITNGYLGITGSGNYFNYTLYDWSDPTNYNKVALGQIAGASFNGNGFAFSNTDTGSQVHGLIVNGDAMWFGSPTDTTLPAWNTSPSGGLNAYLIASKGFTYQNYANGTVGVGRLMANNKLLVGSTTDTGTGAISQITGSEEISLDLNVNRDLNVKRNETINGNLRIDGNISSNGTLGITKNMTVMKTAITTCDLNFKKGLLVASSC